MYVYCVNVSWRLDWIVGTQESTGVCVCVRYEHRTSTMLCGQQCASSRFENRLPPPPRHPRWKLPKCVLWGAFFYEQFDHLKSSHPLQNPLIWICAAAECVLVRARASRGCMAYVCLCVSICGRGLMASHICRNASLNGLTLINIYIYFLYIYIYIYTYVIYIYICMFCINTYVLLYIYMFLCV